MADEVYPLKDSGKEKAANYSAALTVYPTVCVESLLSVALFDGSFSIGYIFG